MAKRLYTQLTSELKKIKDKYNNAHLIIGGDLNDTPDDQIDRIPARIPPSSKFKAISHLCEHLNVMDVWRYMHPYHKEYTWSNTQGSSQSRIDLWLLSSHTFQFVSESSHSYAPFSDHKMIVIQFTNPQEQTKTMRGYWKLNCDILKDETFCRLEKAVASDIFNDREMNSGQKWEFFKFKIRELAIKHSKEIKKRNNHKENETINELNFLLNKGSLTEEEESKLTHLKAEIDRLYMNMTKGAFIRSRAKWLEKGEKNTSYFFALEKRNYKKNNITSLKIDNSISSNPSDIANHTLKFYSDLYSSVYNQTECEKFIDSVKEFTPQISIEFKSDCDRPILKSEILDAINKMKKGKSPGMDGLPIEFYLCFWSIIETPLFEMIKECIDKEEMITTMKQGIITLIPKPDKDHLSLDNWRPITL